ncbi:hypothetical protein MKX01_016056, partial [Papaver californicum]
MEELQGIKWSFGVGEEIYWIWDVGIGRLKLTQASLAFSTQHSTCFLLVMTNKLNVGTLNRTRLVVWSYHDYLSDVYCLALPPTIEVLPAGGRGAVFQVSVCRRMLNLEVEDRPEILF